MTYYQKALEISVICNFGKTALLVVFALVPEKNKWVISKRERWQ
jgi:hypothetical protein